MGDVSLPAFAGAELGHVRYPLIPASLAPQKWARAIAQMLRETDFDRNVFLMTRFAAPGAADPIEVAIASAREACRRHGLMLHLASDRVLDDDLWGNVAAHMWACRYGIAIFEERSQSHLNQNLLIEVGAMLATGRRCALLRDRTVQAMPTDFVGQIYKPVDLDEAQTVAAALHSWASADLGLGACSACGETTRSEEGKHA